MRMLRFPGTGNTGSVKCYVSKSASLMDVDLEGRRLRRRGQNQLLGGDLDVTNKLTFSLYSNAREASLRQSINLNLLFRNYWLFFQFNFGLFFLFLCGLDAAQTKKS